jgi:hypothetical protein
MMPVSFALAAVVLVQTAPEPFTYLTSVSFNEGRCVYWTGDVGMTAAEFRDDLKDRFDPSTALVVDHHADVPKRCIEKALRMARAAGFSNVVAEAAEPETGRGGVP